MITKKKIRKEWKNILFNLVFAILVITTVILLYQSIFFVTIILIALSLIALLKWKSWVTFVIFLFGAFWGSIAEIIAIAFGVWQYASPNFINIPIWLFILWGAAAAFIYQTALEIKKIGVKN